LKISKGKKEVNPSKKKGSLAGDWISDCGTPEQGEKKKKKGGHAPTPQGMA